VSQQVLQQIPATSGNLSEMPDQVVDAVCRRFREVGVMLFKDVLTPGKVEALRDAYEATCSQYHRDMKHDDALLVGVMRHMITVPFSGPFNDPDVYANPHVMPVIRKLLGETAILGSFVSVTSLPGAPEQHAHRDVPLLFEDQDQTPELPVYCTTLVLPLVEMNATNGTTAFFPGFRADNAWTTDEILRPEVPVGSAVLFDSRIWHFGTENLSDSTRPVLYNNYQRPWFRDAVNFYRQERLALSDEEYDRISEAHRGLMAWTREPNRHGGDRA